MDSISVGLGISVSPSFPIFHPFSGAVVLLPGSGAWFCAGGWKQESPRFRTLFLLLFLFGRYVNCLCAACGAYK